jgi:alanine dehydrogenase
MIKTIGFPRMKKEEGEKRVFLPEFIQFLTGLEATVFIEAGYGSRSSLSFSDYQRGNPAVQSCDRQEAFQKDIVIMLRAPEADEFEMMRPGTCLVSMLHYPTRPKRVERLKKHRIKAISLDGIVNDNKVRLVENMKAVAWNGLETAFSLLEERWPDLKRPDGQPVRVLIIGTGMIGKHAVDAATKLGNVERNRLHIKKQGAGAIAVTVGRNVTYQAAIMENLFRQTDVLVDATQRLNPALPVVPNDWIAWLPEHALIVDLSVDPYTVDISPPVVRGIEGIPQGNLDQYVLYPEDPTWEKTVPNSVPSKNRRTVISCYSWPGIHPEASMEHYGQQLRPLMRILLEKGYDRLSPEGTYFERSLYRATLDAWLQESSTPGVA